MVFHHFEVLLCEGGEPWVLGSGAGGTTYKARDVRLQRLAAVKVVAARHFKSKLSKERFLAEAQTAASLHHANLAAIHYFGEQDGDCFYAMEYVDGSTLEELVAEMVAADREEARKEAILRLKGFNVVGSMENPPTNPSAVAAAGGKG